MVVNIYISHGILFLLASNIALIVGLVVGGVVLVVIIVAVVLLCRKKKCCNCCAKGTKGEKMFYHIDLGFLCSV